MADSTVALSADEFASLAEIGKGKAQGEIPQAHGERLANLGLCDQAARRTRTDLIRRSPPGNGRIARCRCVRLPCYATGTTIRR